MKLSFVLPVYNVEKYIDICLSSIFNQGMSENDFEVICVNDGSTDNSVAVIEEWQKKHNNIVLKNVKNGGQGRARNIGMDISRGKYIFFVDSDDYIASYSISELVSEAMNSKVDMLFFDHMRVTDEKHIECRYNDSKSRNAILNGKEYFTLYFPNNGPWHYLISKDFINKDDIRFVEGRYCEDGMFTVLCTNKAQRVMYRHTDVYRYVIRENSTVTKKTKEHQRKVIADFYYAIEYIDSIINQEQLSNEKNIEYIRKLTDRKNSYTFFLLLRMLRARFNYRERSDMLCKLKERNFYPAGRLTPDYGKLVMVSVLFKSRFIYDISCFFYSSVNRIIRRFQ